MLIVVIDDERTFRFDHLRDDVVYLRSSDDALLYLVKNWLSPNCYRPIDQLWLDHDLGSNDTVKPIVDFLDQIGALGYPFNVRNIFVHTQNAPAGDRIVKTLYRHYTCARAVLPGLQ